MAEKIKITFLGTGSAVPTKRHNHSSILLQYKDESILFDCGEGTQRQFRIKHLNPCKLTRILITHWHGDHILGLPGLFQTLALNNYSKTLKIYIPRGTKHFLEKIMQMFVFVGNLKYEIHEIDTGKFAEEKDFYLEAEKMSHGTETRAYSFNEKTKTRIDKKKLKKLKVPNSPLIAELQKGKDISINGKKIKAKDITYTEEGRKIAIILDTSVNDRQAAFANNSDVLITESSFSKDEKEQAKEYLHLTSEQAAEIAKKSKSKRLVLTHLSQRYENTPEIILKEAKKIFKNTQVAEDFMEVEL